MMKSDWIRWARKSLCCGLAIVAFTWVIPVASLRAEDSFGTSPTTLEPEKEKKDAEAKSEDEKSEKSDSDAPKPLSKVVPDATKIPGLITLYRKKDNLFAEIGSGQLGKDFIIVISVAKGIGTTSLYTGQSLTNWDGDMIWQFRKVEDRIQIVRRNYRFQAESGTTEEKSVERTYSDSILYSLPIVAVGPSGGDVVDLTPIFMSDLPGLSRNAIPGFSFVRDRSNWEKVKGFTENVELEIAATYSSFGDQDAFGGTVLDSRGLTVNVHYSISKIPETGYKPRYADERVGYFVTAIKNLNKNDEDGNFIRYINRWNLTKLESDADVSLPKKPIVFWLDKTIPYAYRKPIRDGILEWNKAFEEAGFYNAIEVRQQEENDTWDPEDIRYNTIRWSSANLGFSIGPSRVNPMTGEILDADVVLDVGFVTYWNQNLELYSPAELAKSFCGKSELVTKLKESTNPEDVGEILGQASQRNLNFIDENLFYSQQFGLATTFFDVMSHHGLYAEETGSAGDSNSGEAASGESTSDSDTSSEGESTDAKDQDGKEEGEKSGDAKPEEEKKDGENGEKKKESDGEKELKICEKCGKPIKPEEKGKEDKKSETDKEKTAKDSDKEKADGAEGDAETKEFCSCPPEKKPDYDAERKKLINQGFRYIAAHEVGHTLGLRHNFKQSGLHSIEEINKMDDSSPYGFVGSVMDYAPANIMPEGEKQGDYYPIKLGEYDYWAIKYGYKTLSGGTDGELKELKKIASEQSKPEHRFATDEDRYMNGDPTVNTFDLGDPLEYARLRVRLFNQILPGLNDRIVKEGESYAKLRGRFNALAVAYLQSVYIASRFVGGLEVNRDFKGDPDARPTFVPTPAAKQREALDFVTGEIFSLQSSRFSPELLNHLAPNRWLHWGSSSFRRYDGELEEFISQIQGAILEELLSSEKLGRLIDAEYRVQAGEETLTASELFDKLTASIFSELGTIESGDISGDQPAIASFRRNLQRDYYRQLAGLAVPHAGGIFSLLVARGSGNDISSLARYQLETIHARIVAILQSDKPLDTLTKAHLSELKVRMEKTLDASVERDF